MTTQKQFTDEDNSSFDMKIDPQTTCNAILNYLLSPNSKLFTSAPPKNTICEETYSEILADKSLLHRQLIKQLKEKNMTIYSNIKYQIFAIGFSQKCSEDPQSDETKPLSNKPILVIGSKLVDKVFERLSSYDFIIFSIGPANNVAAKKHEKATSCSVLIDRR